MRPERRNLRGGLAGMALLFALAHPMPSRAQEEGAPPASGEPAAPVKPKPKPKAKKPAPAPKIDPAAELRGGLGDAAGPPPGDAAVSDTTPAERHGGLTTLDPVPQPMPTQGFAAPVVVCEAGQAVRYDGPKEFSFIVTRTGTVTIDNPLRPLTPDVTRVLQLVIAGKLATAYGPDLAGLRRGASPRALEGLLGGPIKWDATLGALPDNLDILGDAGEPLAQMRFRECATAPQAKEPPAPPSAKAEKPKPDRRRPAKTGQNPDQAATPPGAPPASKPRLPQGAIE